MGLEIGSFNPSHLQPVQRASELRNQSFRARYENTEHCESQLKAVFDTFQFLVMGKDKTQDENAAATENKDQEFRDATLAKTIAAAVAVALAQQKAEETQSIVEAVALQSKSIAEVAQQTKSITETFSRQMEKTHVQYEKLLEASHTQNFTSTLKVTSSTDGFRVMDPFDWTADKNIYQRWQLWSHKARLALDAMEGDNEKTKISYLHHWLDGKGISKIKGWRNSKTLITQAEYDALEERDRKGKYSLDREGLLFISRKYLDPQVKPFVSRGRTTSGKARFYDF